MPDETKPADVKPSESSNTADPPPQTPPATPPPAAPIPAGESSNGQTGVNVTKRLLEEALDRENRIKAKLERLETERAQERETRARLKRVFKPGFKIAKQHGKS